MPKTRRQEAIQQGKIKPEPEKPPSTRTRKTSKPTAKTAGEKEKGAEAVNGKEKVEAGRKVESRAKVEAGEKRDAADVEGAHEETAEEPPAKRTKTGEDSSSAHPKRVYKTGTIERGHIYFFYRPKVQHEEAHSIDDVKNFHMLLIPRPPAYEEQEAKPQTKGVNKVDPEANEDAEMAVLAPGADAVPASEILGTTKKHFRLVTVGKKKLPDPESGGSGSGRKDTFWATVTAVGDDLKTVEEGLGEKEYETKTRGTRHEEPARLVARGGYAIVNSPAATPSQRTTHLGYHVSHPPPAELGDVQTSFGIFSASSFVMQVKNPLAPASTPQQAHTKGAEYPQWIMRDVFGAGGARGRENYGLRFVSCETPEMMDYKGAEMLLIAAREGEQGLETSLGEGRGDALTEAEQKESYKSLNMIFKELGTEIEAFPAEPLEGKWI